MRHGFRVLLVVATAILLLPALGCERGTPSPAEKEAIEEAVSGYLQALAASYSSLSVEPLAGHASPNEVAAVRKLLQQLVATGDRVGATLLSFEIDAIEVFREINATVRLVEVWEVVRYDAFSGREKGRNPSSVQTTILQLRRVEGRWLVTARIVTERTAEVAAGSEGGE